MQIPFTQNNEISTDEKKRKIPHGSIKYSWGSQRNARVVLCIGKSTIPGGIYIKFELENWNFPAEFTHSLRQITRATISVTQYQNTGLAAVAAGAENRLIFPSFFSSFLFYVWATNFIWSSERRCYSCLAIEIDWFWTVEEKKGS